MNKILILSMLTLTLIIPSKKSFCQDSSKFFVGYDLFKGIINEQSITFGYKLKSHHLITLTLAYTHDNKFLRGKNFHSLSPSQDKYPFFVYKGPTIRSSYAYRFGTLFYVGTDVFYKYLFYSDHTFVDSEGDPGDVTFTRNEKSNVFGYHINLGFLFSFPNARFIINPEMGIGSTFKYREYTTSESKKRGTVEFDVIPVGSFSKSLRYPSLNIKLNIAVTF